MIKKFILKNCFFLIRKKNMTDNVRQGLKLYCGDKSVIPPNRRKGSTLQCFRRGWAIGSYIKEQEFPKRVQQAKEETKRQLAKSIEEEGIGVLKNELRLSPLSKDLVRSIATRLTGTPQAVPRYSVMTKEQLITELVQRGFQR